MCLWRKPTDMYEYFSLYECVCGENPQTCTNILICMYVCLWREPTDMYEYFSLYVCVCGENPQTCMNISIYIICLWREPNRRPPLNLIASCSRDNKGYIPFHCLSTPTPTPRPRPTSRPVGARLRRRVAPSAVPVVV